MHSVTKFLTSYRYIRWYSNTTIIIQYDRVDEYYKYYGISRSIKNRKSKKTKKNRPEKSRSIFFG